jgi:hypothetical protein
MYASTLQSARVLGRVNPPGSAASVQTTATESICTTVSP